MNDTMPTVWISDTIARIRELVELHVPTQDMPPGILFAVVLLLAGIFLGVFGASYARGTLSIVIGLVGAYFGMRLAGSYDVPSAGGAVCGFALFAAVGYMAHRLWVGLAVGVLASGIAVFASSNNSMLNELRDYGYSMRGTAITEFQVPSIEQAQAYRNPDPVEYMRGFYSYLGDADPQVRRNASIIGGLGLVLGFVLGALWTRGAIIVSCAIVGSLLLHSSLLTLAELFAPQGWEQNLAQHPYGAGGFVLCAFLLSMLVQYRLTRKRKSPPKPE